MGRRDDAAGRRGGGARTACAPVTSAAGSCWFPRQAAQPPKRRERRPFRSSVTDVERRRRRVVRVAQRRRAQVGHGQQPPRAEVLGGHRVEPVADRVEVGEQRIGLELDAGRPRGAGAQQPGALDVRKVLEGGVQLAPERLRDLLRRLERRQVAERPARALDVRAGSGRCRPQGRAGRRPRPRSASARRGPPRRAPGPHRPARTGRARASGCCRCPAARTRPAMPAS